MSLYIAPLSPNSMRGYPGSTKAACRDASDEAHAMYQLTGLPRLHASTMELLCISALVQLVQTGDSWAAVGQHTYGCCVLFLDGLGTAWLLKVMSGCQLEPYELPPLLSHVTLVGRSPPQTSYSHVYFRPLFVYVSSSQQLLSQSQMLFIVCIEKA